MEWLARSAKPEKGQDAQSYLRHYSGVRAYGERFVEPLAPLLPPAVFLALVRSLFPAVEYHDLGKLEDPNQDVLDGKRKASHLPIAHWDAGTVHLFEQDRPLAAVLAATHHTGLPNFPGEANRGASAFRAKSANMQAPLSLLLARHAEALGGKNVALPPETGDVRDLSVFFRMALSLLVDADHTDSSAPNRPLADIPRDRHPPLLAEQRLAALDAYVSRFKGESERHALRRDIYEGCKTSRPDAKIVACDSPVGSGKTTAVMAHLLAIARERGLRRIFVVLPFTNIIRQSAATYRQALVLQGENPDDIVAEIHHLADYRPPPDEADESSASAEEWTRDQAVRWTAPIVVTTAVAFFETLASSTPSALRRLHELAGAAVFVDEAHAALPAKLLPVAWRWMQTLADEWNVHWVLASGSLVRFWEMQEIRNAAHPGNPLPVRSVPMLASRNTRDRADGYEKARVRIETLEAPLTMAQLLGHVERATGPRLLIVNTVQNAAVVAKSFAESRRFETVFHLSTALTPADRAATLEKVKTHLKTDPDGNWVLVGTSCIEAGMDLDFATGFREMSSLSSLLQASGRINREGRRCHAVMFLFSFADEPSFNCHPGLEDSIRVLKGLLAEKRPLSAALCTEALRRELRLNPGCESTLAKIARAEEVNNFPEVEKFFKIIASDTRTVIVDSGLAARLESFQPVDWRDIQRHSVQLWGSKLDQLHVPELAGHPGCFKWHLEYSPFLGCMEGILKVASFARAGGGVI